MCFPDSACILTMGISALSAQETRQLPFTHTDSMYAGMGLGCECSSLEMKMYCTDQRDQFHCGTQMAQASCLSW